jgi:hypothetical protein
MRDEYVVKVSPFIYLTGERPGGGYGFSSEPSEARRYSLDRAEKIAGDLIAKGLTTDPSDVVVQNARRLPQG